MRKRPIQRTKGIRPIRGYTPSREKSDPLEFGLFLKQYNINPFTFFYKNSQKPNFELNKTFYRAEEGWI